MKPITRAMVCLLCFAILITLPVQYAIPAYAEDAKVAEPMIGIGNDFYVALASDGTAWTWGKNGNGQLGTGTTEDSDTPVSINTTVKFQSIAVGHEHVVALAVDGSVWAWGANGNGQLGMGDLQSGDQSTPTQVLFAEQGITVIEVAAADHTSYALTSDGRVFAWGSNAGGRLGIYEQTQGVSSINEPTSLPTLQSVAHIFAGKATAAAITTDGRVWMWGSSENGQAGTDTSSALYQPVCKSPSVDYHALDVAIGEMHTSFLRSTGEIASFGANKYGQFGNHATATDLSLSLSVFADFAETVAITSIAAGDNHMVALTQSGRVFTWGRNQCGQLGVSEPSLQKTPVELVLNEEDTVKFITARYDTTAAIDSEGHVYIWGTEASSLPYMVEGEDGIGYLYLGLPQKDLSQDVYVTANATVPAPSFTFTVPATLNFGTLEQKSSTAEDRVKSLPLTVSVSNVAYLFDREIRVTVSPQAGTGFVLTGSDTTLPYSVYNTANGGESLSVGDTFATFTDDATVSGRIEIDQSAIITSDSYSGTLVFTVSTAVRAGS